MNASEMTERMRVLLDAAIALKTQQITQAQYDGILACNMGARIGTATATTWANA